MVLADQESCSLGTGTLYLPWLSSVVVVDLAETDIPCNRLYVVDMLGGHHLPDIVLYMFPIAHLLQPLSPREGGPKLDLLSLCPFC